ARRDPATCRLGVQRFAWRLGVLVFRLFCFRKSEEPVFQSASNAKSGLKGCVELRAIIPISYQYPEQATAKPAENCLVAGKHGQTFDC
ncbi:MAG: hypothetical protein Q8O35_01680, partial [Humidesulfovibrio sp.]|uniref:hypothetical protein n=1 Tax=Humidesulfovibrio sp. TaxID=2910988 RepID=UPI002732DEC2